MEQRNGCVDRHGQKANEVHIHHFVGRGFDTARTSGKVGDLAADLEFLMRAALKERPHEAPASQASRPVGGGGAKPTPLSS